MSLRTLMFGWEYPPLHSGGLGVACKGLVHGLLKHGTKITLVLPRTHISDDAELQMLSTDMGGSDIVQVQSPLTAYASGSKQYHWNGNIVDELYGPNLVQAVNHFTDTSTALTSQTKTDIVHCHDWMTYEAGLRAAHHHNVPCVAHVHATEYDRTNFSPDPWIAGREKWGLEQADRVIAVSRYTKDLLVNRYGIKADRISVVHNGIDVSEDTLRSFSGPVPHRPIVLFLGRLTIQKNPNGFLDAAAIVRKQYPNALFVMAGDGPMLSELIERSARLGLTENVVFTGRVDRNSASALYCEADCFVMPSHSEPFGLVALEAASFGVPCIVSKQSGAREVLLSAPAVDCWDSDLLASTILRILEDRNYAEHITSDARSALPSLTWQTQAGKVLSIYRDQLTV